MRLLSLALAGFSLFLSSSLFAELAITPEETKSQAEFNKAYRVPDKEARKMALAVLSNAKHSSSFRLLYSVVGSDPDPDVRLAAYQQLAKAPAHDPSIAGMLAQVFSSLKNTAVEKDQEVVINYGKALEPVEFKTNIVNAFVYRLAALRYPDVPALIQTSGPGGVTDNRRQIENVKKQRKFFEELLETFNAVAHSDVNSATKDSPKLIKTWFDANGAKFATADRDLAEKYRKEDLEAAKAAADAAKAAAESKPK